MHTQYVKSSSMYNAVKSVKWATCALALDGGYQLFETKLDRRNFMAEFGFHAENRRAKRRRAASIRRLTEKRKGFEQYLPNFDLVLEEK